MRNDVLSVFTVDINPINSFESISICKNQNGEVIFSRTASKAGIFFNKKVRPAAKHMLHRLCYKLNFEA